MIYITRKPAPPQFYQMEWRTRYLRIIRQWLQQPPDQRSTPSPIDLRGDKVRQLLPLVAELFAHKCAFCEARIEPVQQRLMYFRPQGNVQPASNEYHYYWLSFDWSNLYLACRDCFELRGSEFPVENPRVTAHVSHLDRENAYPYFLEERPLLVDPCLDVPIEYLHFDNEGRISSTKGSRGRYTIKIFDLNRDQLVKVRKQEAQQLKAKWLEARKQMIEREGKIDSELVTRVDVLTAACDRSAQFAGMKAYLLLEWLISETRIALDSADIFGSAIEKEPWNRLYRTAMATLKIEKPRALFDQSDIDNAGPSIKMPSSSDIAKTEITYIYIQGDMYQIASITHSNVAIGRNASSNIQR